MSILINYNFNTDCLDTLSKEFDVECVNVASNQLINYINTNKISTLVYKGKFEFETSFFSKVPSLKTLCLIDNIDLDKYYTNLNNITYLTPKASMSRSVAELVFAHLFGMVRFLHDSNRQMPLEGDLRFNELKFGYKNGTELKGKTLGLIGSGHVGTEVVKMAIGLGMNVMIYNKSKSALNLQLDFFDGQHINFNVPPVELSTLLSQSDFISFHTSPDAQLVISENEIKQMKKGVGIINTSYGGILDEVALINAIESKHVQYAALDVYEKEPHPEVQILMNPELSLTPHIAGLTKESTLQMDYEITDLLLKHL